MNIYQVGAELFHVEGHADGQRDVTKPIVAFRNFANAPKTTLIKEVMTEDGGEAVHITQKVTE
jgi:hypothetical protein